MFIATWWADLLGKFVDTGVSVFAAVVAAISAWKVQLRGQHAHDTARGLLRSSFRVRHAIAWVRNPLILGAEQTMALRDRDPRDAGGSPDRAVYAFRWKRIEDACDDLDASALEAAVLWGEEEVSGHLRDLRKAVIVLNVNLRQFLEECDREASGQKSRISEEGREALERVVYAMDDTDECSQLAMHGVKSIEDWLRPKLVARSWWSRAGRRDPKSA